MVTSIPVLQQRLLRSMVFSGAAGLCTCTFFCKACNFFPLPTAAVYAVMTYAPKAVWQDVLHKTLRKIFVAQRHCFGTASITIIFIPEAHLLCIYGGNAVVAYGYFVGVPSLSILSRA